ncbi:MAG: alanine--tRNA ligase [Bdellovibrionales bacterium]
MTGHEIRRAFIGYFKKHGHTAVPSSRLIPENDDTLLFANAGMNQFKNIFLGLEKRDYNRAVSSQKCVRAGGKHNDLENVGHTARHHTFFEMLGNFSFGDYFKKESIHFGWELLTKELGIPKDKLYVTVYTDDDEAADVWHKQEGVAKDRIFRFEDDNFWMMGDTGPCGPCSEIFYDHGPKAGCGKPTCNVGCSCDRYVEIWNHVFMQFNQSASGRTPLPKPSVDTGAGLERLSAVLQGVHNNYDTDLFTPLIETALNKNKSVITKENKADLIAACRVLADHSRATAFLIADGALPSNEGRGYVLRRIMRRAIRYGRKLNESDSLLLPVVKEVISTMSSTYSELKDQSSLIEKTVKMEEERFLQTLDQGTAILNDEMKKLVKAGQKQVSGEVLFKLYDTFGFPMDLTRVIATENSLGVDEKGFENLMEKARQTAKASWKGSAISKNEGHLIQLTQQAKKTEFTGYEETQTKASALLLSNGEKVVDQLKAGESGFLIADKTCFYAESGGQIGDSGEVSQEKSKAQVLDCTKINDIHLHHVRVTEGVLRTGPVLLKVYDSTRRSTARNHSATHLMHAALRKVLGTHVTQAGSLVTDDRTRFDFTHTGPLTSDQIAKIEELVNHEISLARPVQNEVMGYKEAIAAGAMALFGEKYGDRVRVLKMGDFSTELCGGTHVHNTSDIRLFKIVSESGVSAGVRRIEAITGDMASKYLFLNTQEALQARKSLGANVSWTKQLGLEETEAPKTLETQVNELQEQIKKLQKEIKSIKGGNIDIASIAQTAKEIAGGHFVFATLDLDDREVLSQLTDKVKDKIRSGVVIIVGKGQDSHPIIVTVTKDLQGKFNAGKLLQAVAAEMGGKGGGRPDFAQGAGKDLSKLAQAQKAAEGLLGLH